MLKQSEALGYGPSNIMSWFSTTLVHFTHVNEQMEGRTC